MNRIVNLQLVYGCCFPINTSYQTLSGEIDGWTFVNQILEEKLKNNSDLGLAYFGNCQESDTEGVCIVANNFASGRNQYWLNVPSNLHLSSSEINRKKKAFRKLLESCQLIDTEKYQLSMLLLSNC